MAITKNIVTDYGATIAAGNDDGPAFSRDLYADLQGQDCTLTIPAGSYLLDTKGSGGFGFFFSGATSLTATATGASLIQGASNAPTLGALHIAQKGIDETTGNANGWPRWPTTGGHSARIQSVSAGATSITLDAVSAAAGHISRAVVGGWILVSGFDTQGLFQAAYGYPPNAHFYDFVQITAVDTTNKIISFTPALTESYSSLWPEFNRGSANEPDSGGPASVYFMHPDWGTTFDITGGDYYNTNLIICSGKDFTIRNASHSLGGYPVYPTMNKNWSGINLDTTGAGIMELDKFAENILLDGGTHNGFHTQSSSLKNITIRNLTVNNNVNGTGRNTVIDTCVISGGLSIGCDGYGRADTFVCRNTSIAGAITSAPTTETGAFSEGVQDAWSMSAGVITIPMSYSDSQGRVWTPDPYGRNVLLWKSSASDYIGSFRVLSVTADRWPAANDQSATTNITSTNLSTTITVSSNLFTAGDIGKVILVQGASGSAVSNLKTHITAVSAWNGTTQDITVYRPASRSQSAVSGTVRWGTCNMYIQTDQSGGLPNSALWIGGGTGKLYCEQPAARTVSFENCTGSVTAVDLSQAAARNRPLWSYSKRTYNGNEQGTVAPDVLLRGNIVSIKVNVLTAYTGVRPTLFVGFSQFGQRIVQGNSLITNWLPTFNLKQTGERVITIGSTTGAWTGTNPDTNYTLSVPTWICRNYAARLSQDISAEIAATPALAPSYTIEFITDQGFYTGPTAVAPLRLRLRAA